MALISIINVPIRIAYLDGNPKNTVPDIITLPEGTEKDNFVTLLYRPGHYDIVYPLQ